MLHRGVNTEAQQRATSSTATNTDKQTGADKQTGTEEQQRTDKQTGTDNAEHFDIIDDLMIHLRQLRITIPGRTNLDKRQNIKCNRWQRHINSS